VSILKQVIHYSATNSIEATWVDQISPAIDVPESKSPDTIDPSTGAVIPGITTPAHVIPGVEIPVKCHSYADVQMEMFRADVAEWGGDISESESMIATVTAGIKPVDTPTPAQQMAEELSAITATYKADIVSLQMSWLSATVSSGPAEVNKKSAIQSDLADTKAQYLLDVAEIKARYA